MNASKKLFMVMAKFYSLVAFGIILFLAFVSRLFMSRPFVYAFSFSEMELEIYTLMLLIIYFVIFGMTVHSMYFSMAIKSGISRKSFLYS